MVISVIDQLTPSSFGGCVRRERLGWYRVIRNPSVPFRSYFSAISYFLIIAIYFPFLLLRQISPDSVRYYQLHIYQK